ncbi:MAG: hypothetical protein FJZ01_03825 [Candidatus Sericytochromatia bacterium]|nr:hypothetical protein [Candidatus Tanganyikabacteria bacterium]
MPAPEPARPAGREPRLEIRSAEDLAPAERAQLARADLLDLAATQAWEVAGSNRDLAYATHGVFRYFGKFPPPLARYLIETFTPAGGQVADPMCGSGTTGVEALLSRRGATLLDVNPLSLLLARVKTTPLDGSRLDEAVGRVLARYRPLAARDGIPDPVGLRNADHWFLPDTSRSLRGLRAAVDAEPDPDLRNFLLVAFAATVRRVSRATMQQGRLFLDAASALPDARPVFERRAARARAAIGALPPPRAPITVGVHDLRTPPAGVPSADLVVCHPPYFNSYKYSGINALELAWLGFEPASVRKCEVREYFKAGDPANVAKYLDDMALAIGHAAKLLRPAGTLALMIGDTVVRGDYLPVTRTLLDRVAATLRPVRVCLRVPRYTEATWVASQRRRRDDVGIKLSDFVILLERA